MPDMDALLGYYEPVRETVPGMGMYRKVAKGLKNCPKCGKDMPGDACDACGYDDADDLSKGLPRNSSVFALPAHLIAAARLQVACAEYVGKAEGARGGHVIGHTKSGKPIYDIRDKSAEYGFRSAYSKAHQKLKSHLSNYAFREAEVHAGPKEHSAAAGIVRDAFPDYTAQDHADASQAHHELRHKPGPGFDRDLHRHAAKAHAVAAHEMDPESHPLPFSMPKGGETASFTGPGGWSKRE